jgi:hypothetical protein
MSRRQLGEGYQDNHPENGGFITTSTALTIFPSYLLTFLHCSISRVQIQEKSLFYRLGGPLVLCSLWNRCAYLPKCLILWDGKGTLGDHPAYPAVFRKRLRAVLTEEFEDSQSSANHFGTFSRRLLLLNGVCSLGTG